MRFRVTLFNALLLASAFGCASQAPPAARTGAFFVEGLAHVVSVDQVLGTAVLEIGGSRINAYWQTEQAYAQPGTFVANGPLAAPSGAYREPVVRAEKFAGNPGDLIAYIGLQTGHEILLRSVQVVSH